MRVLRWLLLFPGAILAGIVGSLAGGIVASAFGQGAADTSSAFVGTFVFVFAACLISPSHRQRIGTVGASLVALLAVGTVMLSTFTAIEEFARLSPRERVVTPVAQILGALYALFIGLPVLTPGTTLERLWREVVALGSLVAMLGLLLAVVGAGAGVAGLGWLGFRVGLSVVLLGGITWVFPFVQATSRARKARAVMEQQLREIAAQEKK